MSVQTEITRITTARNTLRTKAVSLGIGTSTDNITQLATEYNDIVDRGTPNAEVQEGESYAIQPGYYHGGSVAGVAGGGTGGITQDQDGYLVLDDEGGSSSITVSPLSVTSNGTYIAPSGTAYSPVTVNVASSGGDGSQVIFIDYDGTVLYSYSFAEFSNLSDLPANPTHTGLVSQGWNWTKAQIEEQMEGQPGSDVIVGQMYNTSSGATEVYIDLSVESFLDVRIGVRTQGAYEIEVDWGDNTTPSTISGTRYGSFSTSYADHTYAAIGSYKISITRISGQMAIGRGDYLFYKSGSTTSQAIYHSCIKRIHFYIDSNIVYEALHIVNYPNLEYITLPANTGTRVTSSKSAFQNDYSLRSITIPQNLIKLTRPSYDFYLDSSLVSVSLPYEAFSMGSGMFGQCYSLRYWTFLNLFTGTSIPGNFIAGYNVDIKKIIVPSTVTQIQQSAFNLPHLEEIELPDNLLSLSGFENCYSLKSISLPSGLTTLGQAAFKDCRRLTSIDIPETVTTLSGAVFQNCYSLVEVILPNTITSLGNTYIFQSCYSLKSVTLPSSITSLPNYTFSSCRSLTICEIPNTVTSIGNSCFYYCGSLTHLTIPASVTSIGTLAFAYCNSCKEYHFLSTTPPTLAGTNAFSSIQSDCIIYVPSGSLSAYQTATNWSTYASYMQEE